MQSFLKNAIALSAMFFFTSAICLAQSQICELYGSVYVEKNPNRAHFLVYEADSESSANMLVFQEDNRLFADRRGAWFFTNNPGHADFIICFVNDRSRADISIYYTDVPSFAGCH